MSGIDEPVYGVSWVMTPGELGVRGYDSVVSDETGVSSGVEVVVSVDDVVACAWSSSFVSFHHESYVSQIVLSKCLAQPMAMSLAVVRSWGDQAVSIMGQTSRC